MAMAMAMAAVLLLFVLAAPAVHSVQYTIPWDLGTSYGSWATKKLNVGDVLVFTYISELHSVDVVAATDYATCKTTNPLSSFTGGQTSIPLTAPGPMYFLCPTAGHCLAGMKLTITVSAAAATPTTTPATPPPTPAAAPPAASANTTAATPSPSPTTAVVLSPSPSPSVSPSPAATSPTGSPASSPSPATSTTAATASPPESSSGARSMVIGFSVVVASLAGLIV